MDNYGIGETSKKTKGFAAALVFIFLAFLLSINLDLAKFSEQLDLQIPAWFNYVVLLLDALVVVGLILIYMYRKIGVFMVPVVVLLHYTLHQYYMSVMLYSDLFTLFVYSAAGLFVIIPRWRFFK